MGPATIKKSEQVGNSASTQPQGYAFILIAMRHQCYDNVKSDHHATKIGVATNELINHLSEAAQRANSSMCKMLLNKVSNNNAFSFNDFVDQSSSTFQLVVASVDWISKVFSNQPQGHAFILIALRPIVGFQRVVELIHDGIGRHPPTENELRLFDEQILS